MSVSSVAGRAARPAAALAAVGLAGFAAFQICLAFGAPWGRAAWGGAEAELATGRRIASGLAAIVLIAGAFVVLARAGYWRPSVPAGVLRWGTLGLTVLLALSGLGNLASSSNWERFLNGPLALLLALACLVVALGSREPRGAPVRQPLAGPRRPVVPS
jgi:hypothetical protein